MTQFEQSKINRPSESASINARPCGTRLNGFVAGFCLLVTLCGCTDTSFLITPVRTNRDLVERTVARESAFAAAKIALVDLDGLIGFSSGGALLGGEADNPVALFKERLDQAAGDSAVKAVVLRINSPGGGVTASDLMYQELLAFKARTHKPVVTAMLDVAASGGYYIACGSDRIVANSTTVTGSIGVIMLQPNLTGTLEKIGAHVEAIKSGQMKDAGSPFREMTAEDRAYFQAIVTQLYEGFLKVVHAGRPGIDLTRLRELADGRVYLAPDAKAHGLIDDIGSPEDAIVIAKDLAGLRGKSVRVVTYARSYSYRPNIYAETPAPANGAVQYNFFNVNGLEALIGGGPRFLYLWQGS